MHPTKLKIIMFFLTPPAWVLAMVLLAGAYVCAMGLNAYDRFKAMSTVDRVQTLAIVLILVLTVLAFATQKIQPALPYHTCHPELTDWQCNVYAVRGIIVVVGYILFAWVCISMGIIWQMIRIVWRYFRRLRWAESRLHEGLDLPEYIGHQRASKDAANQEPYQHHSELPINAS